VPWLHTVHSNDIRSKKSGLSRVALARLWQGQPAMWARMRTSRWQWVAAPWAMRSQPCAAVDTELPVRFDLALAIVTLLDELMKLFTELQQ